MAIRLDTFEEKMRFYKTVNRTPDTPAPTTKKDPLIEAVAYLENILQHDAEHAKLLARKGLEAVQRIIEENERVVGED